jgi:hypothetical protein
MNPEFKNNIFVGKEELEFNLLKTLDKLENNLNKIELAINQNKTYLQKDSYQLLVNLMTPENKWERLLFSELLTMCFKLEIKCHGSSVYFLRAFSAFAREYKNNGETLYTKLVEHNQEERERYLKLILRSCYPAKQEEVDSFIASVAVDPVVETIVKEAVSLAGIEGNIVIEEADIQNNIVELQFGYNFAVDPFKGFIPQFGTWIENNLKVLLIDGMIEKVSELDKVLLKSYETKIPLLIVAQGYSEEVIATIYTNTSRGNFNVMPIRVQQSLEALNMLNDIAVVSGCDVVSTLKGEMLTFVDYDALPLVQKATITNKVLTIENNATRNQVLAHLHYLNNRRKEQAENTSITDLADLTTKRIGNLLAHIVKIKIPKKEAEKKKAVIDNAIRACRTLYTYGLINPDDLDTKTLDRTWSKVHKSMLAVAKNKKVPSISFYLAAGFAANLASAYFTSSGGIIQQ